MGNFKNNLIMNKEIPSVFSNLKNSNSFKNVTGFNINKKQTLNKQISSPSLENNKSPEQPL